MKANIKLNIDNLMKVETGIFGVRKAKQGTSDQKYTV
jgi:hypothetical protein